MISSAVLEKPGKWRWVGIGLGLTLVLAPALPLFWLVIEANGFSATNLPLGASFSPALGRSLIVALLTIVSSLLIGLPTGLLAALYDFPARRFLLGILAVPLLVPSFLWAIGLSMLRIHLGLPSDSFLSGASGSVIAFTALGLPLVIYMSFLAGRGLSRGQVDAVRVAGGDRVLFGYAARNVFPAVLFAAVLAGVLTLSDPGPGQILGFSGVAAQILVSFSALYDFELASRQCLALAAIILVVMVPLGCLAAPRLAEGLLGKEVDSAAPVRRRHASWLGPSLFAAIFLLTAILPLAGLIYPVTQGFPVSRAMQEVSRTAGNTLIYSVTTATAAALLGCGLAICAGRETRPRAVLLVGLLAVLTLPPAVSALGVLFISGTAPAVLDPMLRSHFTVGAILALRFLPIAAIFAMRSLGAFSPSWVSAAAVHGLGLNTYVRRILAPMLFPAAGLSALLVGLLASAEVGTILLLQPPGEASLAVAIFTVMANAPEALVASLCLLYFMGAVVVLVAGWFFAAWAARRQG